MALRDEYETAIEAFTVIEDSIGDINTPELKTHIDYLRKHIPSSAQNKHLLLKELLNMMESFNQYEKT